MIPQASDSPARHRSHRLGLDAWGVVFCGGASKRMGRDKARLWLSGSTLVDRAVAVLAAATSRVVLASGSAARYPELGLECVLDEVSGAGPLAGLDAALTRLAREGVSYACVLACDMPRVDATTFVRLLARARERDADVCLVATEAGLTEGGLTEGGIEPLCGVYHVRVRAAVSAALARGERRMIAFHELVAGGVRLATIPEAELGLGCAYNLNTPEEFEAAGGSFA